MLFRFHCNVGGAIDDVALNHSTTNTLYIVYCARRAIHLSRCTTTTNSMPVSCNCIFSLFPFPFSHTSDLCQNLFHGSAVHSASLVLTFITLCLKDCLLDHKIEQLTEKLLSDYLSVIEKVGGFSAMTTTDLSLIYKLLIILELADGPPQRFIELDAYRLRTLGSLLCRIYIPVVLALKDLPRELLSEGMDNLSTIGINLLLKAVHICEKLKDFTLSDEYMSTVVHWHLNVSMGADSTRIKLLEISSKVCL